MPSAQCPRPRGHFHLHPLINGDFAMFSTLSTIFILVFSTPEMDTLVGAFDTQADCEEVAWTMERYLSGGAKAYCVAEQEA